MFSLKHRFISMCNTILSRSWMLWGVRNVRLSANWFWWESSGINQLLLWRMLSDIRLNKIRPIIVSSVQIIPRVRDRIGQSHTKSIWDQRWRWSSLKVNNKVRFCIYLRHRNKTHEPEWLVITELLFSTFCFRYKFAHPVSLYLDLRYNST